MSLRSLPRIFLPGATPDRAFELPEEELKKLRHVLRLSSGAKIAILPNDGTAILCELQGRNAQPLRVETPPNEPKRSLTLAQALPKGDKLDDIVKACTGIGVSRFLLFSSERTVVSWDEKKRADRLRRLSTIAREEAEVSFRTRLPVIEWVSGLAEVLKLEPQAQVLSEIEGLAEPLRKEGAPTLVVGPEGGWDRKELALIGDRGVTLGPRVLRVEHAGAAAAALMLLD